MTAPSEAARLRGGTALPSLTGMRFVAALMVFALHATVQGFFADPRVGQPVAAVFTQGGWTGVGFFFILSGFVLTWSARRGDRAGETWRRRALKIFPNHLVTFAVAVAIALWFTHTAIDGGSAVFNLLLVQSFFPQFEIRTGFNGVAWSLSCELLFYMCFPLLHRLVSRIPAERMRAWVVGVLIAIFAVPTAAVLLLPAAPVFDMVPLTESELWLVFQFPPTRMLEFVLGMLLARTVITGGRLPLGMRGATVLAVASYVVAALLPGPFAMAAITALPVGLLIAAAARVDIARRPTWFATRPMVWLGEVSFAFYMVHVLVLNNAHLLLGGASFGTPVAVLIIGALFAVALALAHGLHSLVERPIMRRFTRRRPVRVAGAPPAGRDEGAHDARGGTARDVEAA